MYKKTTQVPNILLDHYLKDLTIAELKILLVIIRQTNGWIDTRTGRRKTRDRISRSQFQEKTGLCRRVISKALHTLMEKGLIAISNQAGKALFDSTQRKGMKLYYSFQPGHFVTLRRAQKLPRLGHESDLNKTNYTKLNETKLREGSVQSIGEVIAKMATNPNYISGYSCTDFQKEF